MHTRSKILPPALPCGALWLGLCGTALAADSSPGPGVGSVLQMLLGLFAGLGHWFVISAYLLAPASQLTPFAYLQMIWATLYGFAIFGQLPDHWSALGMVVIVASGLWLASQERWPMRRALPSLPRR